MGGSATDKFCPMCLAAYKNLHYPLMTVLVGRAGLSSVGRSTPGSAGRLGREGRMRKRTAPHGTPRQRPPRKAPAPAPAPAHAFSVVHLPDDLVVLVVDDEDAIRESMSRILELEGYDVLVARDGENALDVASRHHEPINLVVTDLVMPNGSGRALFHDLRRWYPKMPFI